MASQSGLYRLPVREVPVTYDSLDLEDARFNNQFIMSGINPFILDEAFDFFLGFVFAGGGGFDIKDFFGNTVASLVLDPVELQHTPLLLPGGFSLVGTIKLASGFRIRHEPSNHTIIQVS